MGSRGYWGIWFPSGGKRRLGWGFEGDQGLGAEELFQPGSHGSCIHFVLLWVRWRSREDKGHVPVGCAAHLLEEQELLL